MGAIRSSVQLGRNGRLGMSAIVASTSTLIALLSHVLAGGPVPELQGVLVPMALAVIVCLPLSGRLHSLPRLVPAVLLSQLLYHWLFVLGAPGTGVLVAAEGVAGQTGHEGHAFMLLGGAAAASADGLMWAAHGIAALITITLIRRGESAVLGLQRLVELIARAVLPALPPQTPLTAPARRTVVPDLPAARPAIHRLAAVVSRRGPPQRITLAAI